MFDANMRHLPKGYRFLASVHSIQEGSPLYEKGVRRGDVLVATMLDEGHDNPRVTFHLTEEDFTTESNTDWKGRWVAYEGSWKDGDLVDFPYDTFREKALEVLASHPMCLNGDGG